MQKRHRITSMPSDITTLRRSLLQLILLQYLLVLLRRIHAEVIQKRSATSDFAQKSATRRVVHLVFLQMLGQKIDFLCEDGDLHMRGTGVLIMRLVLADQLLFDSALERHDREVVLTKKFMPRLPEGINPRTSEDK